MDYTNLEKLTLKGKCDGALDEDGESMTWVRAPKLKALAASAACLDLLITPALSHANIDLGYLEDAAALAQWLEHVPALEQLELTFRPDSSDEGRLENEELATEVLSVLTPSYSSVL